MEIIDEDGRLFGRVNMVDALVVLFALAVTLAGVALVAGDNQPRPTETRYVTLDFGVQPDYVAEHVDAGDASISGDEVGNLTITDTYLTAREVGVRNLTVVGGGIRNFSVTESGVRVIARVAVTGRVVENRLVYDGSPLRLGRQLSFRAETYAINGIVQAIGEERTLATSNRTVILRMENVAPERADSVETGLTETNDGLTVARVLDTRVETASVTVTSEDGNIFEREHPVNKDVILTVELRVRERASRERFKGRVLQEGNEVFLDLGTTTVRTTVVDLDAP